MRSLTQAFTFGLALAAISALGRRRRTVMVVPVPLDVYHTPPGRVFPLADGPATRAGLAPAAPRWRATVDRVNVCV